MAIYARVVQIIRRPQHCANASPFERGSISCKVARETIRSTLEECSIVDWHGEIETRRRSKKRERKGKRRKKTRKTREKKEKKEQKKRGEEEAGEKKVEGPWEVNVRLCDHWRMHTLLLFTRLTKLVYTETGTGRRAGRGGEGKPPRAHVDNRSDWIYQRAFFFQRR